MSWFGQNTLLKLMIQNYPGSSSPAEGINITLERLRGSAFGFRNLINYTTRLLLETGGFRHQQRPNNEEPVFI